jgi:hypothetical protein
MAQGRPARAQTPPSGAAAPAAAQPAGAPDRCIAANEEALSLRKQGKLRASLQPLAACGDPACPAEIKAECERLIAEVKSTMPTLTFVIKDRAGNDVTGVTVTMDGAPLSGALEGRPLPLDPGEHVFRFEAAGLPPLNRRLVLRVGEKDRRENVVLGAPPPPGFWTPLRATAAVATGAGVVGLAVGGVFAGFAVSAKSRENADCSAAACKSYPQAVADYEAAKKNAAGSTFGFVAGGVVAAWGIVMFVAAPRPKAAPAEARRSFSVSPLVARSSGGLALGGSF